MVEELVDLLVAAKLVADKLLVQLAIQWVADSRELLLLLAVVHSAEVVQQKLHLGPVLQIKPLV